MHKPLLKKLELEHEALKSILPQGQATGESINITDSSNLNFEKFNILGNSIQETRSGKNVLNVPKKLTFTQIQIVREPILAGTYKITCKEVTHSGEKSPAIAFGTEGALGVFSLDSNTETSITLKEDCNRVTFYSNGYNYDNSANIEATINELMISKDGGEYEEFGVMPSLGFPSKAKSVGENGNIDFKIMNKNILDFGYKNSKGIIYDKNKIIVKNPTDYSYANPNFIQDNEVLRNKKIKITTYAKGRVEENSGFIAIGITGNSTAYQRIYNKNLANEDGEIDDIYCQTIDLQDSLLHSILFWTSNTSPYKGELELNVIIEIVDEIDSVPSEFIEHEEQDISIPVQKPLRAVNNHRDTFNLKNGKWYEKHYINRRILNGTSETILESSATTENNAVYSISNGWNKDIETRGNLLCNYLKNEPQNWSIVENCIFGGASNQGDIVYIKILKSYAEDVDAFKAKLKELYDAETPLYVDYLLAEPEEIECNEEQTKILNKIEEDLHTYKNVTNIISEDETSPVFEIEYIKDLETLITKG